LKQFWREAGLAVILGLIMPGFILHIVTYSSHRYATRPKPTENPSQPQESVIFVPVLQEDGTVTEMELDAYLTGVILAEMPASFEVDALMAQAVVARTYTLRADQGKGKHENAAVCTDATCCQAYRTPEDYAAEGGSYESIKKVRSAVQMTKDLVLVYEGELIEATYFSCSGGSTEDAVAVWGTDIPYLQATDSPGEEEANYFTDSMSFTQEELSEHLGIEITGDPSQWFGEISYTDGGGVADIRICGEWFHGTQIRKLLGLRSTAFTVSTEGSTATFHTRGHGHRVGMSQYGADAMAAGGSNFEDILYHYYQGTELVQYAH